MTTEVQIKAVKRKWIKFYPQDYLGDDALRMCSLAARGLWMDMLCVMAGSGRTGWLVNKDGVAIGVGALARLVGAPPETVESLLVELESYGVFSRGGRDQTIYSRRMVHDAKGGTAP